MPRFWSKLNGQIRYQVYLRVLPVVALAVLLLGIFGWALYTDRATKDAVRLQKQELESLLTTLRYRAGRKGEWREAVTRDLSLGGLSIADTDPPPLGQVIEMELLAEGAALRIEGRIVRVERYEGEERATVGVEFQPLAPEIIRRLGNL